MAQILKKNILSIVCGAVVLLAVAAYFVFVQGLYTGDAGLEAKARERQAKYNDLAALITKSRTLPVVELGSKEATPLEPFPTVDVIAKGTDITKQLTEQSKKLIAIATAMNRREPLLPNFFPKPTDPQKFRFRDRYKFHMDEEIPKFLNASGPPNDQAVAEAREKLWVEKYADQIITINNVEANREQVEREYMEEIEGLLEQLEEQTARKFRMYIENEAVNKNPAVASQVSPPTEDIWYAQTAMWVQDEVVAAIAAFNERELRAFPPTERSVINSPVKHLITLLVEQGISQYIAKAASAEGETPGALDYKLSPTGRNSGSLYDVVKFTLVVKVDARYVPRFLQELGRGRFITVHKVNMTSVDTAAAKGDGFVYGNHPVMQVQLTGEALLMREWTKPMVPDEVKKHLPQFDPPAPAAEEKPAETAAAR